jgi:indole-3-acetate monooxygenase
MTAAFPPSDWLAQARALAPLVAAHRDLGERERRLPRPVFTAACAAGFLRMLTPRALGGAQAGLGEALAVSEEFGRQDGSCGWNLSLLIASPLFADYLPAPVAHRIFGQHDAVVAGSLAPRGQAIREAAGYRLSGRWTFVSGCQNANWMFAGGVVLASDQLPVGPEGTPEARVFAFPITAGTIIDTWHTTGMRGTGSHDYTVANLFVPADWSFPFQAFSQGPASRPGQGYPRPFLEIAPLLLAAVGLGVARDAVEAFTALATAKTPLGATQPLAVQATVQERVGRAEALLRAARSYLFATAGEVEAAPAEAPPQVLSRRLAAAHAAQTAVEVVNMLYAAAGGSSIYATSRLERCFRDINTLSHHVQIAPGAFVAAGEALLQQRLA